MNIEQFKQFKKDLETELQNWGLVFYISDKKDYYSHNIYILESNKEVKSFGLHHSLDDNINKYGLNNNNYNFQIYSPESNCYSLFSGILVWFDLENIYFLSDLILKNSYVKSNKITDFTPYIQTVGVESKPFSFFKNNKNLIIKYAINKWKMLNNKYNELIKKQPEIAQKEFNNFIKNKKKKMINKKINELEKDFDNEITKF